MVVEYLLLLVVSAMILAGAFSIGNGPVKMFQKNSPHLAYKIEKHLESGETFRGKAGSGDWQR